VRSDPSQVAHGWESTLGVPEITKINDICGNILKSLGYDLEGPLKRAASNALVPHQPHAHGQATASSSSSTPSHGSTPSSTSPSSSHALPSSEMALHVGPEPWWKKNAARLKKEKEMANNANRS
jgi:hypothetical protein